MQQSRSQRLNNFLSYNNARYNRFLTPCSDKQKRLIHMLPLLMHTNINLMPGYISPYTSHGIASFIPDERSLEDAARLNKHFSYDQDNPPTQNAIEALFIQECILSGETIFWVIHNKHLDKRQLELLDRKTASIIKWLEKFHIHMSYIVSDAASISYNYYSHKDYKYHIDKCFFLDNFYAESVLLAGKIPAWWLELDEQNSADDDEIIPFGDLIAPRPNDYLSAAIWHLSNIFRQPGTSWVNLCLIDQFVTSRQHGFFSATLRQMVHSQEQSTDFDIRHDYSVYLKDMANIKSTDIDFSVLADLPGALHSSVNSSKTHTWLVTVFHYLSSKGIYAEKKQACNIDYRHYQQTVNRLFELSENLFRRIKTYLSLRSCTSSPLSQQLNNITNGLLSRLVETETRLRVINLSDTFTLDKVHFKHNMQNNGSSWSLLMNEQDADTELLSSGNLVQLICQAFINRLISTSTQVSIQCADFSIRQIDVQNIIRSLQTSIGDYDFTDIGINNFVDQPKPVSSVLFIGHNSDNFRDQTIDQLIIYNTGEVYVHSYRGLHVFYDWFEAHPDQSVNACLYGSWANDYRSLNRKILSRISNISVF